MLYMEPTTSTSLPWTDIVVAIMAVYAAALSTYTFFNDRHRNKPKLKVTISKAVTTGLIGMAELQFQITAANSRSVPVTISRVGLLLPDGQTLQFIRFTNTGTTLPCEVTQGKRGMFLVDQDSVYVELAKNGYTGSVELRAFCATETDDIYESNPFTLKIS